MQSCRFFCFFLPTFHENFKFPKNGPYDFQKKNLHSRSTPKEAPACANASKLYEWNVRNIAKISPKLAKKQPFLEFLIFAKTVHTIRTKFSTVILYTIIWSYVCIFIKIVWQGLERVRRKKPWADSFTAYAALEMYVIEFGFLMLD